MFHSVSAYCFTFCIHVPLFLLTTLLSFYILWYIINILQCYMTQVLCINIAMYWPVYYNNKNASCLFLSVLLISNWTITFWVWRLYNLQVWMYQAWIVPKLYAYFCPPPPTHFSFSWGWSHVHFFLYFQSSLQHTSESKIKPVIITH